MTSCECERNASALCPLHSWIRATTGQELLSSLAQIHIHHDMPVDLDKVVMQAYIVCTYGSTKNGARQFTVILDSIDSQSMSDWSYRLNSDCQWTLCLLSDYDYNGLLLIKLLTHALMHSYDKLFSRTFFFLNGQNNQICCHQMCSWSSKYTRNKLGSSPGPVTVMPYF